MGFHSLLQHHCVRITWMLDYVSIVKRNLPALRSGGYWYGPEPESRDDDQDQ